MDRREDRSHQNINQYVRVAVGRDADAELAPFRARLDAAQWATALAAARARLVRIALSLPTVAFD